MKSVPSYTECAQLNAIGRLSFHNFNKEVEVNLPNFNITFIKKSKSIRNYPTNQQRDQTLKMVKMNRPLVHKKCQKGNYNTTRHIINIISPQISRADGLKH